MKKILIIVCVLFLIISITNKSIAYSSSKSDTAEIINTQKETLNISDFIKESESYTKESMPDIDLNNTLTGAITGTIDNVKIIHAFLNIFGKELVNSLSIITSIIVIIVIHGILKSIGDGLQNKGVIQIAYYVQYILIVTVVMKSFADIVFMVKTSIENLVNLSNLESFYNVCDKTCLSDIFSYALKNNKYDVRIKCKKIKL